MTRLKDVLAQGPAFLVLLDRRGRIAWCSRIEYGLDRRILGTQAVEQVHPDEREAWLRRFRRAVRCREPAAFRVRLNTPEGEVVHDCRLGPVLRRGQVRYVAIYSWDVTDEPAATPTAPPAPTAATPTPPPPTVSPATPPAERDLSPGEEKIVQALPPDCSWTTTAELAKALGREPTSDFRLLLRNLAGRGVVETSKKYGIRLLPAGAPELPA